MFPGIFLFDKNIKEQEKEYLDQVVEEENIINRKLLTLYDC